jgi:hypothetical protein
MRRVWVLLSAVGLFASAAGCHPVGCHHVAGVCDCVPDGPGCCYGQPGGNTYSGGPAAGIAVAPVAAAPVLGPPGTGPEPLHVMPKVAEVP